MKNLPPKLVESHQINRKGLKEKEMIKIANFLYQLIEKRQPPQKIKKEVISLCKKFPLNY